LDGSSTFIGAALPPKRPLLTFSCALLMKPCLSWVMKRYTAMRMRSMSTGSVTKATDIHHVIWAMLSAIALASAFSMPAVSASGWK